MYLRFIDLLNTYDKLLRGENEQITLRTILALRFRTLVPTPEHEEYHELADPIAHP